MNSAYAPPLTAPRYYQSGGISRTEDEACKVHIQYKCNAFCKTVLRPAAIANPLKLRRRWEQDVSLPLLRERSEKIAVHECSYDGNGTHRQETALYYSFVGKLDLPEA